MKRLLLVLVLVVSCSSYDDGSGYISTCGCDASSAEDIKNASAEWCERSGFCLPVVEGKPCNLSCEELESGPGCFHYGKLIRVEQGERVRFAALHEIGHKIRGQLLGLDDGSHLPPGNIMTTYYVDAPQHLTELDVSFISEAEE